MTNDGGQDPDETQPFVSPSGPEQPGTDQPPASQWPTYAPPPSPPAPPAPPSPPVYGQPQQPPYGQNPYLQQPPYPQQPYGAPQFSGYGVPVPGYSYAQAHGRATTSMVLGIIALVGIIATPFCCVTLPAMFCGPFAIWTGATARRDIDRNPAAYNNRGQAVAGFIMGIVASVLAVLIILVILLVIGTTDWTSTTY